MVSVRCMRPGLPGGNVITAKRVPCAGGAVPRMRAPRSSTSSPIEMSAGAPSVDQIRVEVAPEAPALALVAGPSMITLATLFRSWPVTTRRIGGNFGWPVLIALRSPCRGRPQAIGRLAIGGIEPHSCHYGAFVARGFLL